MEKILVINPGSTSTKIAVYAGTEPLFTANIEHTPKELAAFPAVSDQYEFRRKLVVEVMENRGVARRELSAVVARGGLLPPVKAGAYEVNDDMVWQMAYRPQNEHASNLGAPIAKAIAGEMGIKAYVYDPVTVDELIPAARITGLPEMRRKAMAHNLNMRATAIKYAKSAGAAYETLTLIVAHLGGGITLTLHRKGRMIDVVSDEEGPFSPERSGGLPVFQVIDMMSQNGGDKATAMKKIKNCAGLSAHLGTKDAREVEALIESGDDYAWLIYEAMALSVAKHIAGLAATAEGKVDGIILTGGIAYSEMFTGIVARYAGFIAPVSVIPGENELEALAFGALRVLRGEEQAHTFKRVE